MFVTTQKFAVNQDFNSVVDADALCQAAADASTPLKGRKWRAWLSDDAIDARDHVGAAGMGSYVRPDNKLLGTLMQIAYGMLKVPPSIGEDGLPNKTCPSSGVWTGSKADGTAAAGYTCSNWTDPTAAGIYGSCEATSYYWEAQPTIPCGSPAAFYCFEQHF
jgi:hypothetical protein